MRLKFFTTTIIILAGILAGCAPMIEHTLDLLASPPTEPGLNVDPKNYSFSDVPAGTIAFDRTTKMVTAVRFDPNAGAGKGVGKLWNTSENVSHPNTCAITAWRVGNVERRTELPRVENMDPETAKHLLNNRLIGPTERVEQRYESKDEMLAVLGGEQVPEEFRIQVRCRTKLDPILGRREALVPGCAVVSGGGRAHVLYANTNFYSAGRIDSITLRRTTTCDADATGVLARFGKSAKQSSLDSLPPGSFAFQGGKLVAWRRDAERDRLGYKTWHFINTDTGLVVTTQGSWRDNDEYLADGLDALGVQNNKPTKHECIRNLTRGAKYVWASAWTQRNNKKLRIYDMSTLAAAKCEQPSSK